MNWFEKKMEQLSNDPQYIAEKYLMDLTEQICSMGQPSGLNKFWLWLLELSATRLIWRKR